MKNILTKIKFDNTFIIMAFGLVITGHFSNLIIFTSLIIIHELGHSIMAMLFKYKVKKIIIYPYGGITKLDTLINTNINKDLLVAASGLFFQSLYFIIIFFLYKEGIVREYIYNQFYLYHKSMFIFNILPIIPLDGSKIINLILSKYINFNLSNNLTVVISFITIIYILVNNIYEYNYSFLLVIGVILYNIYIFYKDINYIYQKFMLERYLYNINYNKIKIIRNKNKMYKNYSHFIEEKGKLIKESTYLSRFYKKSLTKK